MNVTVQPGQLTGEVEAPSSKSEAHRLLICAAFAPGTTDIDCTTSSDDIDATVSNSSFGAMGRDDSTSWRIFISPLHPMGRHLGGTGINMAWVDGHVSGVKFNAIAPSYWSGTAAQKAQWGAPN